MPSCPILYFVIPCYNEEVVLPITNTLFLDKLTALIAREKLPKKAAFCLWMTAAATKHGKLFRICIGRMPTLKG